MTAPTIDVQEDGTTVSVVVVVLCVLCACCLEYAGRTLTRWLLYSFPQLWFGYYYYYYYYDNNNDDYLQVSGHGLALVGIPVEQDAAYWEAHVEVVVVQGEHQRESPLQEAFFGVSTKKDQKFYRVMMEEQHEGKTRCCALCCIHIFRCRFMRFDNEDPRF